MASMPEARGCLGDESAGDSKEDASQPSHSHLCDDDSARYSLEPTRFHIGYTFVTRVATVAALISAIVLGIDRTIFDLGKVVLGKLAFDQDVLLLLLGVINKIMDYALANAIENIVQTMSTIRMVRSLRVGARSSGIKLRDLKMKEELTKPWKTLYVAHKRWRVGDFQKNKGRNSLMCFVKLVIAVYFLLIGACINTTGIPKLRWYPDAYYAVGKVQTVQQTLTDLVWNPGNENVKTATDELTLAAMSAYQSFKRYVPAALTIDPNTWHRVDNFLMRNSSSDTTETAVVPVEQIKSIGARLKATGPRVARLSMGMLGVVTTRSAHLTTHCLPSTKTALSITARKRSVSSMLIDVPDARTNSNSSYTCSIIFNQLSLPIFFTQQDYDAAGHGEPVPDWQFPEKLYGSSPEMIELQSGDSALVDQLVSRVNTICSILDRITPEVSFATDIAQGIDRMLLGKAAEVVLDRNQIPQALTPIIALLIQQIMSSATLVTADSEDGSLVDHRVRFWTYGAGPRLKPEYIALVPLFVMIFVCIFDIALLFYRIMPAPWLEPAGLLCLANTSGPLAFTKTNSDVTASDAVLYARAAGDRLQLVDGDDQGHALLDRRTAYHYQEAA